MSSFPKNSVDFFDAMRPADRERVEREMKDLVWRFATATAMGYKADGTRVGWQMPEDLCDAVMNAGYNVAMDSLRKDADADAER